MLPEIWTSVCIGMCPCRLSSGTLWPCAAAKLFSKFPRGVQGTRSSPASPSGTAGSRFSPPTLLRGSAADMTASHFGFRRSLSQQAPRQNHHALPSTPKTATSSPNQSPNPSATNRGHTTTAAPPRLMQFSSGPLGGTKLPSFGGAAGPVAEGSCIPAGHNGSSRVTPDWHHQNTNKTACCSCSHPHFSEASKCSAGLLHAVAEARQSFPSIPSVNSGLQAAAVSPSNMLVEVDSGLQHYSPLQCTIASCVAPATVSADEHIAVSAVAADYSEYFAGMLMFTLMKKTTGNLSHVLARHMRYMDR
jgi:hypothetical protein